MTEIKQIVRWAVMVFHKDKWMLINYDGNPSHLHLPKTWHNKADADKVAKSYTSANIIQWEGR